MTETVAFPDGPWRPAADLTLSPARRILAGKFQRRLEQIAEAAHGVLGVSVLDLTEGAAYGVHQDLVFPAASSIKLLVDLALHVAAERGRLTLEDVREVDLGEGLQAYPLAELSRAMIDRSDNLATNLVIEAVGMEVVNALADELDCPSLRLRRLMLDEAAGRSGIENTATPADAARFMARLLAGRVPLAPGAAERLRRTAFGTYPEGPARQEIPAEVPVIQMPGGLAGVRNSWAAVALAERPYAFAVMGCYGDFETLTASIREVARESYDYFRRLAGANALGVRTGQAAFRSDAAR